MGKVGIVLSLRSVKLHLICATNRVPISYELTPANTADVSLAEELLGEADLGGEVVAVGSGCARQDGSIGQGHCVE